MYMQRPIPNKEVQHLLQQHYSRVIQAYEYQQIDIRRQCLLQDATKQFQRQSLMLQRYYVFNFLESQQLTLGGPDGSFAATHG